MEEQKNSKDSFEMGFSFDKIWKEFSQSLANATKDYLKPKTIQTLLVLIFLLISKFFSTILDIFLVLFVILTIVLVVRDIKYYSSTSAPEAVYKRLRERRHSPFGIERIITTEYRTEILHKIVRILIETNQLTEKHALVLSKKRLNSQTVELLIKKMPHPKILVSLMVNNPQQITTQSIDLIISLNRRDDVLRKLLLTQPTAFFYLKEKKLEDELSVKLDNLNKKIGIINRFLILHMNGIRDILTILFVFPAFFIPSYVVFSQQPYYLEKCAPLNVTLEQCPLYTSSFSAAFVGGFFLAFIVAALTLEGIPRLIKKWVTWCG